MQIMQTKQTKKEKNLKPEGFHGSRRDFLKLTAATGASVLLLPQLQSFARACGITPPPANAASSESLPSKALQAITPKDFSGLKEAVPGLSAKQITQHIGLYEGYVTKLNRINESLIVAAQSGNVTNLRDLQLSQSYALNGAILHELYFSNLGSQKGHPGPLMQAAIARDFGDEGKYVANLRAVGQKMRGWAMTGLSLLDGKIYNYGLDSHDVGTPLGVIPLVVLDVYEHAYMIDYGTNRDAYLDVFLGAIYWPEVEKRLACGLKHL